MLGFKEGESYILETKGGALHYGTVEESGKKRLLLKNSITFTKRGSKTYDRETIRYRTIDMKKRTQISSQRLQNMEKHEVRTLLNGTTRKDDVPD